LRAPGFLGAALALGLYSKFSYPLFVAALLLAALSLRDARARLADPRLLLSVALALAVLAPFVIWIVQVRGDVVAEVAHHMIEGDQSFARRVAIGLGRLLKSLPLFLLPWIAFVALLAPSAFKPAPAGAPAATLAERLALRTMIFAAILAALGIAATGATNIAERYMHPILIIAPVYLFARIARLAPGEERIARFAYFAIAAAIVILGVRFVGVSDIALTRRANRGLLLPYAELAAALQERGIAGGTAVSPQVREAGNLRAFLPRLRVVAADSLRVRRPPRRADDERSCILVWTGPQLAAARRLAPVERLQVERIEIGERRSFAIAWRGAIWFVARLDPKAPACL
jgi:hypothetical protein